MLNERGIKAVTPSALNTPAGPNYSPTVTPYNSPGKIRHNMFCFVIIKKKKRKSNSNIFFKSFLSILQRDHHHGKIHLNRHYSLDYFILAPT